MKIVIMIVIDYIFIVCLVKRWNLMFVVLLCLIVGLVGMMKKKWENRDNRLEMWYLDLEND